MINRFKSNPHRTLIQIVALNVAFDVIAIAVWAAIPATTTQLSLGFTAVAGEAAIAAAIFTITLYGLVKRQKWAPPLAIAVTVLQRTFGTYVFFPSPGIALTAAWSILLIYFAYKTTLNPP